MQIQSSENNDRIDIVVVRADKLNRTTDLFVKKGTAAITPSAPELTRSGDIYEIALASVFIAKQTTSITQQRITDLRLNAEYCEAIPTVNTVDTTSIFQQYQAALNDYMGVVASALNGTTAYQVGIQLYTHSVSSGTHNLTGTGVNGKFKATATAAVTAFKIGTANYNVKAGSETQIELVTGVWYSFILDEAAKTVNFNSGGGLSNSKLALATATAADVKSGKTFYAGNKTLKTGTKIDPNLWLNNSGQTTPAGENGVTVKCTVQGTYTYAQQCKAIDLTGVNTITFNVTATSGTVGTAYYSMVGAVNNLMTAKMNYTNAKVVTGVGTVSVDVSALSGLCTVFVQAGYMNGASITISGYTLS